MAALLKEHFDSVANGERQADAAQATGVGVEAVDLIDAVMVVRTRVAGATHDGRAFFFITMEGRFFIESSCSSF